MANNWPRQCEGCHRMLKRSRFIAHRGRLKEGLLCLGRNNDGNSHILSLPLKCYLCPQSFCRRLLLIHHIQTIHDIQECHIQNKLYDTEEEAMEVVEHLEEKANYRVMSNKDGKIVKVCNRDGSYQTKASGERAPKKSIRMGSNCTAFYSYKTLDDGRCSMEYCTYHIHDDDVIIPQTTEKTEETMEHNYSVDIKRSPKKMNNRKVPNHVSSSYQKIEQSAKKKTRLTEKERAEYKKHMMNNKYHRIGQEIWPVESKKDWLIERDNVYWLKEKDGDHEGDYIQRVTLLHEQCPKNPICVDYCRYPWCVVCRDMYTCSCGIYNEYDQVCPHIHSVHVARKIQDAECTASDEVYDHHQNIEESPFEQDYIEEDRMDVMDNESQNKEEDDEEVTNQLHDTLDALRDYAEYSTDGVEKKRNLLRKLEMAISELIQ